MGSEQPARPDLWNGDALEGVNEQHFGDEVSGPRGQVAGQVVDATLDLLEQVGDVLVIKGQTATQQSIQDDAAAPYIYFWAAIQLARDDLKAQQTGNCCDSKMMQMHSSTVYYVVPGVNRKTTAVSSRFRRGSEMPSQTHKTEVQLILTGGKTLDSPTVPSGCCPH